MITLNEFVQKYDGKYLEIDANAPAPVLNQCMDLFYFYQMEVLGYPRSEVYRRPTAYDVFENGHPDYEKIYYKPGLVPVHGDVMFWSDQYVKGTGHVAVYIEGNDRSFVSFDQNWPVKSPCHTQGHSYEGVVGWLRHKSIINEEEMTQEERDTLNKVAKFVEELSKGVDRFRMVEGSGKLVYDAKLDPNNTAGELVGRIWSDSSAMAALMRAAGVQMISKEEAKKDKYVDVMSGRDVQEDLDKYKKNNK